MPTVEQNLQKWNTSYEWTKEGDEWSATWGGAEAQWFGAVFPRIHNFLPAGAILEIAPGFGRWTRFLKNYCEQLTIVDLGENCINACRQRFASESHIRYHVNDGKSLAMIPDESVDFVFSMDSLVHVEADVMDEYLRQLAHKLKPDGVGFIHHSNIGSCKRFLSANDRLPHRVRNLLIKSGLWDSTHWRATSMTARVFAGSCERAGLRCIGQELVNWGTRRRLIDCLSLFTRQGSAWERPNRIAENPGFMHEAMLIKRTAPLYAAASV